MWSTPPVSRSVRIFLRDDPANPQRMSAEDRREEVASILPRGILGGRCELVGYDADESSTAPLDRRADGVVQAFEERYRPQGTSMSNHRSDVSAKLERIVDELLLRDHPSSLYDLAHSAATRANQEQISYDMEILVEIVWGLARAGVIALAGEPPSAIFGPKVPSIVITPRGRELLQHKGAAPHHKSRYMDAVKSRVSAPDDVVLSYLDEAVEAWRAGLYRASAVMLGCACEKLILLLAEAIAHSKWQPHAGQLQEKLSGRVFISDLFDAILAVLSAQKSQKALPSSVADALERRLSAIFDHARVLRNQAGHPTGTEITAEEAEAGLLLFPGFYAFVDEICIHCKANNL